MKEIQLTQGKVAFVDDEDFESINKYRWHIHPDKLNIYAVCKIGNKVIRMHRIIMNARHGQIIDHIDGNGLNNQKSNLRFCTHSQNNANRRGVGKSKYLGVIRIDIQYKLKSYSYWAALCQKNKKNNYLGTFKTEEDAARAYDEKAKELHGEFARLNFPKASNPQNC